MRCGGFFVWGRAGGRKFLWGRRIDREMSLRAGKIFLWLLRKSVWAAINYIRRQNRWQRASPAGGRPGAFDEVYCVGKRICPPSRRRRGVMPKRHVFGGGEQLLFQAGLAMSILARMYVSQDG